MPILQPLVSIIMNCYNGDKYLLESINSVLSQTYDNWEIIFWDNQSTDNSAKIFKSIKDNRLKYFYAPDHSTLGIARNRALEKANGEWCAILDCDDTWTQDKLQKQIEVIERNLTIDVVYSNYYIVNYDGKIVKSNIGISISKKENVFFEIFTHEITIPWPTVIIRKKSLHDVNYFFDYKSVEDFDILLRLANTCKFYCINENLAFYRIHQNQLSINYELILKEIFEVYDYWFDYWNSNNYTNKQYKNIIKLGKARILFITGLRALLQSDKNTYIYFKKSLSMKFSLKAMIFMFISKNKHLSKTFNKIYIGIK